MPAGTVVSYHLAADSGVSDTANRAVHASLSDQVSGSDLLFLCRSGAANLPPFQGVRGSSPAHIHCLRVIFGVEDTVPHSFLCLTVLLHRHGKHHSPTVAQRHSHRCIPVRGISLLVIDLEIRQLHQQKSLGDLNLLCIGSVDLLFRHACRLRLRDAAIRYETLSVIVYVRLMGQRFHHKLRGHCLIQPAIVLLLDIGHIRCMPCQRKSQTQRRIHQSPHTALTFQVLDERIDIIVLPCRQLRILLPELLKFLARHDIFQRRLHILEVGVILVCKLPHCLRVRDLGLPVFRSFP